MEMRERLKLSASLGAPPRTCGIVRASAAHTYQQEGVCPSCHSRGSQRQQGCKIASLLLRFPSLT